MLQTQPFQTKKTGDLQVHGIVNQVRKRDGRVVAFDINRIITACGKAMAAVQEGSLEASVSIAEKVYEKLVAEKLSDSELIPDVEFVQDQVERQLILGGFADTAKAYILYRQKQSEMRAHKAQISLSTGKFHVRKRDGSMVLFRASQIRKAVLPVLKQFKDLKDTKKVLEQLVEETKKNLFEGISTHEIDQTIVFILRARIESDPLFSDIAARYLLNSHYKNVIGVREYSKKFTDSFRKKFISNIEYGIKKGRLDPRLSEFDLNSLAGALDAKRDHLLKYLGLQTIIDRYFLRDLDQNILEVPQFFWMRVAMGLSIPEKGEDRTRRAIEFYEVLSKLQFVSSTPTLFHSGTHHPQLSSCYLTTVDDDLGHIFKCIGDNAQLSKWSGGLGNDWSNVRGTGSQIKSTNVPSQGVIPFLKIADTTTAAINRSGKRRGATCAYLETWHFDIESFLELKKNTGDDRRRTHDMNTANWIPDLFMKRVLANEDWTLFSPDETPDLHHLFGSAFEKAYKEYEALAMKGKIKLFKRLKAQDLWKKMVTMLFETGHPWMTFKDPCNIRSPQDHMGVVHSSNLCTEITLNTSATETAVCNLGSVNLAMHVTEQGKLDTKTLKSTVQTAIRMLDNVVDINFYPTIEAQNSNLKHRPIGLGIMGLQDALYKTNLNFDTDGAVDFSDKTMEFISYWAISTSSQLAKEKGAYESFPGSKWDRGIFPLDTLKILDDQRGERVDVSRTSTLDWDKLKAQVAKFGMRNSNCMAIAPTATISNIVGSWPTVEPIYNNLYVKANQSGDFTVLNDYLIADLQKMNLWNDTVLTEVKNHDGSIAEIAYIPNAVREKYKTAFEIDPIWVLKHAAVRGKWIDQSQSINLFLATTSGQKIAEAYIMAWKMGLKTTYYLRTMGASGIEKSSVSLKANTIEVKTAVAIVEPSLSAEALACKIENGEDCEACQ